MDAFEQLISEILWMEGHWVRTSVKVELTREERAQISLPTAPRWEIDVLAFKGGDKILRVIECKSWLDYSGVSVSAFNGRAPKLAKRFKLFNDEQLRQVVFERLRQQLIAKSTCPPGIDIRLCLACGRIATEKDRIELRTLFDEKGWELWDETWICKHLKRMAGFGYENQVSAIVSKLLLRGCFEKRQR